MKVRVSGIAWDCIADDIGLPDSVTVELDEDATGDLSSRAIDAITDQVGFCILSVEAVDVVGPNRMDPANDADIARQLVTEYPQAVVLLNHLLQRQLTAHSADVLGENQPTAGALVERNRDTIDLLADLTREDVADEGDLAALRACNGVFALLQAAGVDFDLPEDVSGGVMLTWMVRPRSQDAELALNGPLLFPTRDAAMQYLFDEYVRDRIVACHREVFIETCEDWGLDADPLLELDPQSEEVENQLLAMLNDLNPVQFQEVIDWLFDQEADEMVEAFYRLDSVADPAF